MNKQGQLDEINPVYLGLGLVAGMIALFVTSRVPNTSIIIKLLAAIGSTAAIYFYLTLTE